MYVKKFQKINVKNIIKVNYDIFLNDITINIYKKNIQNNYIRFFSNRSFLQKQNNDFLKPLDSFSRRHIGPRENEIQEMLSYLGYKSLESFVSENVPKNIQNKNSMNLPPSLTETQLIEHLKNIAKKNRIYRSFIGMGYYGTHTPYVILRNIIENPGWYTPYTPYQAEISQGRLESLLNFQTMICDLTKMDISNASLLDEATAAAEAMNMCFSFFKKKKNIFYVSYNTHPQTIAVLKTRAEPLGIQIVQVDPFKMDLSSQNICGVLLQYPATDGTISDFQSLADQIHSQNSLLVCATDLLACALLKPPGEWGADIVLGSAQRFGVPMGYGGPHAAFFAVKENLKRSMPGRLIGVSIDSNGQTAYRMALQTREQHIRRETATSNICTSQALLANVAAMYAVYHGPEGIKKIAERTHMLATLLANALRKLDFKINDNPFFDTVKIEVGKERTDLIIENLEKKQINIRKLNESTVTISLDETTTEEDIYQLISSFAETSKKQLNFHISDIITEIKSNIPEKLKRTSTFLTHPNFNSYHSETDMLRYLKLLENKDLSLTNCMIPLGSCTMKLNATAEMIPITWPEFSNIHPFVPLNQVEGYLEMFKELSKLLCEITGFYAVSLQPNSGAQGEYTGLRVIKQYFHDIGQSHRDICIIPQSAHGTNPASAAMAGMKIVVIKTDKYGNVDFHDLKQKVEQNSQNLACLMITYPSTYGVFEDEIANICQLIHQHGGQVYMDGANMNSQVGLCNPAKIGADVCHLNLHKTFCIPHGGGGPGMGPICVAKHLAPYLPQHPVIDIGNFGGDTKKAIGPVSAAPFSSASILPISYAYIRMMGTAGLTKATQVAILNANYMAKRLKDYYNIVYTKPNNLVAHEFIIDFRPFKEFEIDVVDAAKRLADFGFHAPTVAFPIHDTMMIEPTESEPKIELDKLCDALIQIRQEIKDIQEGKLDKKNNPLVNAPHTAKMVTSDEWDKPYSRQQAAFPVKWITNHNKYWPPVSRIDGVYGDRNLFCVCPPIENFKKD